MIYWLGMKIQVPPPKKKTGSYAHALRCNIRLSVYESLNMCCLFLALNEAFVIKSMRHEKVQARFVKKDKNLSAF
jgi:hypothetical protein